MAEPNRGCVTFNVIRTIGPVEERCLEKNVLFLRRQKGDCCFVSKIQTTVYKNTDTTQFFSLTIFENADSARDENKRYKQNE